MNAPAVATIILSTAALVALELHRRGLIERRPVRVLLYAGTITAVRAVAEAAGSRFLVAVAMYAGLLAVALMGLLIAVGPDLLDTCLTRRRRSLRGWWFRYRHKVTR